MIEEARASQIVERIIFGGSFVSARPAPNDFDCVVVLHTGTRYEMLSRINAGLPIHEKRRVAIGVISLSPQPISRRWASMWNFSQ
jgi:hypothetical protein